MATWLSVLRNLGTAGAVANAHRAAARPGDEERIVDDLARRVAATLPTSPVPGPARPGSAHAA
jgi:hypothetical protein